MFTARYGPRAPAQTPGHTAVVLVLFAARVALVPKLSKQTHITSLYQVGYETLDKGWPHNETEMSL